MEDASSPLDPLLVPLASPSPTGEWLRYDPVYDEIKQARQEENPNLSQGIWERELKKADWPLVQKLCEDLLKTRTKDLQVAVWLGEAWFSLEGLEGATRSILLLQGLCETFWEGLYPTSEDQDYEHRLRILESWEESFARRIMLLPLPENSGNMPVGHCLGDWELARRLATQAKKNMEGKKALEKATKEQKTTLPVLQKSLKQTDRRLLRSHLQAMEDLGELLQTCKNRLADLFKDHAPTFQILAEPIEKLKRLLSSFLESKEGQAPAPSAAELAQEEDEDWDFEKADPADAPPKESVPAGQMTRAQAYGSLREVADFLETVETMSVSAPLIRKIASWESKSLPEILGSFGNDPQDAAALLRLLGLSVAKTPDPTKPQS